MPTSVRPTPVRPTWVPQVRTTGAALAAVAVLATAAPAVLPGHATDLPAITRAYDLTAATDISGQAAGVVFLAGWGDFIGPDDPYFPGEFNNDLRLTGPLGVAYYLIDTSMDSAVTKDLENYIFELAGRQSDPFQAVQAAVQAAVYVAVASNLGVGSVPAKLAKSLVYGVPFDVPGAIVQLTAPIPLAGDIISVYFTGRAEGDPAVYGTGVNGLIAYSGTLLPWLKPLLGPAGEPQQAAAEQAQIAVPAVADAVDAVPQTRPAAAVRADGPADIAADLAAEAPVDIPESDGSRSAGADPNNPGPNSAGPNSAGPDSAGTNDAESQAPAARAVAPADIETPSVVESGDSALAEVESPAEEASAPALDEIPASLPDLEIPAEADAPAQPADPAEPADPAQPGQPGAAGQGADASSGRADRQSRRGHAQS